MPEIQGNNNSIHVDYNLRLFVHLYAECECPSDYTLAFCLILDSLIHQMINKMCQ
jgi:hypothetical protein